MNRFCILRCALLAIAVSTASRVTASLIDFEQTPSGGTPVDDAALSTPYNLPGGGTVQFFFDVNANNSYDLGTDADALFEAAGADGTDGFANGTTGIADTANGGLAAQLGNFFLRQPVNGSVPPPFIIDYNTTQTISALSGEIWDIDGNQGVSERWLVEVLNSSNSLLTSQLSPVGNSAALDALPWGFSFTGLPAGVDKLRVTFVGTKTSGLGLAFNNFTPIAGVPEPGTVVLMGTGCGLLLALGIRRRRWRASV